MNDGAQRENHLGGIRWSALFFLCLLVLWQILVPFSGVPRYLLPTPTAIVEEFGNRGGLLMSQFFPTFYETVLGFLLVFPPRGRFRDRRGFGYRLLAISVAHDLPFSRCHRVDPESRDRSFDPDLVGDR